MTTGFSFENPGELAEHDELPAGFVLGRYRIERVLARGRASIVYLAADESLRRPFAIKEFFPAGLARRLKSQTVEPAGDAMRAEVYRDALAGFVREAQLLSRVRHPNVAEAIEVIERHGTAYYVMPFFEGKTLEELAPGGMSAAPDQVLALVQGVLAGLAACHAQGIFHRDIQPASVLLTAQGQPVLIDFGGASSDDVAAPGTATRRTGFVAPELYSGDPNADIARADLYAVGALAYWLAAGEAPVDATARAVSDRYVPLRDRLPKGWPRGFVDAVDRALSFRPADRFASAAEFLEGLAGTPRTGRTKSIAIALALLLTAAGLAWYFLAPVRLQEGEVLVPAGSFVLGTSKEAPRPAWVPFETDEAPQAQVQIDKPFVAMKHEVTVAEFERFVTEARYQIPDGCEDRVPLPNTNYATLNWKNPGFPQTPRHPVVCVSWKDADAYARWLSERSGLAYRLPTEAEWEYAARGGSDQPVLSPQPDDHCRMANILDQSFARAVAVSLRKGSAVECSDGSAFTAPVGSFAANAFGLFDVIGNAWEWTADCYSDAYKETAPAKGRKAAAKGPQLPCAERVSRGGSYLEHPAVARFGYRGHSDPDKRYRFQGFRLVRQ